MTDINCPVAQLIQDLEQELASGRLHDAKNYRRGEEILALLNDVAWGRAGQAHLPAIERLAEEMRQEAAADAGEVTGGHVLTVLRDAAELFQSHIETHNCASGDCVRLAPAPCQMTCPAGIDVPTYVSLIGAGRDADAIRVIREDNPFPWVCGLVCTRPCEFMCVRGRIDKSVSIKFLKAFAAERALSRGEYQNPPKAADKGQTICIVGAGPGGMSAAYYLALKGYRVRVIEAQPSAGGMILLGIPRYRLPREVIDREVAMLQDLGVDFVFNTRLGKDVSMQDLQQEGFAAFLLAIGAHKAYNLGIPGEDDFPQVLDAIGFLRDVALGNRVVPGKKVIVIGGGNVAIDAARTSLRLGATSVILAYRRTRHEMPADEEEVEQAEEEGVEMRFLTIPEAIIGRDSRLEGLRCLRAELVAQEGSDRMRPVPVENSEFDIEADAVISAIGQQVDTRGIDQLAGLDWTRRSTLDTNMVSMQTSLPGIFAVGDAVTGPATVIEAIGAGKRAAEGIDRYLSGIPQPKMPPVPVRRGRIACQSLSANRKMTAKRPEMALLNIDRRRTTFQQVELGYMESDVREEAGRCLRCDICLRCGKCVEVCRDKMTVDALQMGYFDFDNPVETDYRVTAERCILCGACAANCPTGAMQIEDRDGERVLSLCGTVLNREALTACAVCGTQMEPFRYLEYVRKRTKGIGPLIDRRPVCDRCARQAAATTLQPES
ncbi:MAG: NAD(P)-binding protein [Desulfobacterales bacterium]|jgi:NADPH-dependent glutamate synthase beta subunit-like oxidoreductase/ferredoxin